MSGAAAPEAVEAMAALAAAYDRFAAADRLAAAKQLGPRSSLTGQPLDPELPAVAAAQAGGFINAEHIAVIRDTVRKVQARFDALTARRSIGACPPRYRGWAQGVGGGGGDAVVPALDQDGPAPDDRERDKARGVTMGKQRRNGNTPISGEATPELAATLEAFFAKFAAPGMCNPDDPEPCVSGTPSQTQIDGDHPSVSQRQHDSC